MKLIIIKNKYNEENEYNLELDQSLLIKNCTNSKFIITNKINKIIILNSDNIYIKINRIITSIEITQSNNILINGNNVPCIELYKSTVYLLGNIYQYKNILIISELSNLLNIQM
jgi:hypothetical protein